MPSEPARAVTKNVASAPSIKCTHSAGTWGAVCSTNIAGVNIEWRTPLRMYLSGYICFWGKLYEARREATAGFMNLKVIKNGKILMLQYRTIYDCLVYLIYLLFIVDIDLGCTFLYLMVNTVVNLIKYLYICSR